MRVQYFIHYKIVQEDDHSDVGEGFLLKMLDYPIQGQILRDILDTFALKQPGEKVVVINMNPLYPGTIDGHVNISNITQRTSW